MFGLQPPRHISTLPRPVIRVRFAPEKRTSESLRTTPAANSSQTPPSRPRVLGSARGRAACPLGTSTWCLGFVFGGKVHVRPRGCDKSTSSLSGWGVYNRANETINLLRPRWRAARSPRRGFLLRPVRLWQPRSVRREPIEDRKAALAKHQNPTARLGTSCQIEFWLIHFI